MEEEIKCYSLKKKKKEKRHHRQNDEEHATLFPESGSQYLRHLTSPFGHSEEIATLLFDFFY